MRNRLKVIATAFILLAGIHYASSWWSSAQAAGELVVSFDASSGKPLFDMRDISPGESMRKTVTVYNGSNRPQTISLRGVLSPLSEGLEEVFTITVREGSHTNVSERSLRTFLTESIQLNGIVLSNVLPGAQVTYEITMRFSAASGNMYQSKRFAMDLIIGSLTDIPAECTAIRMDGEPIYGSEGSDRLLGTNGNDLILAREGNDIIYGNGGDDCIVSTSGNKVIFGGQGNDIISLGRARGFISGDGGNDILFGTTQSILNGGPGTDVCVDGLRIGCERDRL